MPMDCTHSGKLQPLSIKKRQERRSTRSFKPTEQECKGWTKDEPCKTSDEKREGTTHQAAPRPTGIRAKVTETVTQ